MLIVISGISCTKDQISTDPTKATAPSGISSFASTATGTVTLALLSQSDIATTFTWSPAAGYSANTPVTYTLQYDSAGKNFANPNTYSVGAATYSLSLSQLQLNNFGKLCGIPVNGTGSVEFRVVSSLGIEGALPAYTNTITLTYNIFDVVVFWGLPGKYQGWDNTQKLLGSTDTKNYEGYVYVPSGTSNVPGSDGFKIVPVLGSWNVAYGDGGGDTYNASTFTGGGNLSSSGGNIMWPNIGNTFTSNILYLVQATTTTWLTTAISSLSVIGDFNGWAGDVPMTYNTSTGLWTATVNFTGSGGFKIRANNAWTLAFGTDASAGGANAVSTSGGNITAPAAGSHVVTLDLTHPKRYTVSVQ